jgi:WD40 repeat protein
VERLGQKTAEKIVELKIEEQEKAHQDDKTARLWYVENGQPIGSPFRHEYPVICATFSTDGQLLVTGYLDKNAYAWDISAIVKEVGLSDLLLNPTVS